MQCALAPQSSFLHFAGLTSLHFCEPADRLVLQCRCDTSAEEGIHSAARTQPTILLGEAQVWQPDGGSSMKAAVLVNADKRYMGRGSVICLLAGWACYLDV